MQRLVYGQQLTDIEKNQIKRTDFNYTDKYPEGLKLHPDSELSKFIVREILSRAQISSSMMIKRFDSWNEQDKFLTAYKRIDDDERNILSMDDRKPVSIVFPYSYAILETLLSYMMTAFFRDPIFRYEGYSPDDVMGAILLEKVINLHCNKFKVMLNLHTMFRDAFVNGFGVVAPIWKMSSNQKFEGNALINIDPYRYLPDPNVAAGSLQEGEFIGWVSDTNYINLLSDEYNDEDLFNVKYLKLFKNRGTSIYDVDNSARNLHSGVFKEVSDVIKPITEINMYIKIIPKEWKLGESQVPEKWFFRIAGDSIVLSARPAAFDHDKFPLALISPDFDGYSPTPLGRMEITSGLQGVLDFLFNTHITNVRKAINDTIIYDPYLVNSNDLKDPKPGKLIRMRRPAWGMGKISDAVKQLQINDITQNNINDSNWIVSLMQKIGATDDTAMGALRSGGPERLTKAEFQGTAAGGISRLERVAKLIGLQGMQDIGEFFAEHTKQVMDKEEYIKVTGAWSELLKEEYSLSISRGRMKVSPDQLDINYDVLVRDGSIPGGNNNGVYLKMFEILSQQPELTQKFDIVKVFKHILRGEGAKNVDNFIRQGANIQQNETIDQEVQKGNLIPLNQAG